MKRKHGLVAAATVAVCSAVALPAEAIVRVGVDGGIQHFGANGTYAMGRAEASVGALPWFHLGGYAQLLEGFGNHEGGWGAGAVASFRPGIPGFKLDPMAFASAGYQRIGVARGFTVELGAGVSWHVASFIDLELRGAWVNIAERGAPSGFSGTLGIALVL